MIRKYHNHKLQTAPWHREEEPPNHHETPGRQIKQSNQLSLPHLSLYKCVLLNDHNAVTPVRLEPAAPWSRVMHSTTEPLRPQFLCVLRLINILVLFCCDIFTGLIDTVPWKSDVTCLLEYFFLCIFMHMHYWYLRSDWPCEEICETAN